MKLSRILYLVLLVCSVVLLSACPPAETQPAKPPAAVIDALRTSAQAGIDGNQFEQSGDLNAALAKYEAVRTSAGQALAEYQQSGIPFEDREVIAYWLAGRGHYDSARMQIQLGYSGNDSSRNLKGAGEAISSAINLDEMKARKNRQDHTERTWKLYYQRGEILLHSNPEAARADFEKVKSLKPDFRPAYEQVAFIDYLQGRNSTDRSPGGIKFPEKRGLSTKTQGDIILFFAKYVFKEYAEELSLAKNIWDEVMK